MDLSKWEEWFLPNADFLDFQDSLSAEDSLRDEFFSYIVSPDCSSCDLSNNAENNIYDFLNDDRDDSSLRTAYHMTSTMYGCQGTHKPLKVWCVVNTD